jgi:large conductance mechanosensitive channel
MIKELRDFIFRGNIITLAVAVVIGGAFAAVVNSLVADIITPLLGVIGLPDFSTWTITINNGVFAVGNFLNTVIAFLAVAIAIFFLVVKPMSMIEARNKKVEEAAPAGPTEIELLAEIRDELRKRA